MTSDGSSQVNLTNPPRDTYHQTPDWQPLPAFRLDSRAITIPFRDIVLISGRFVYGGQPVISGQRLTLWEQPANSFKDFTPVPGTETTTDNDGSFAFEKVQPKANTNYQVRFAGDKEAGLDAAMSQIKPVDVRVLVSLGLSTETLSLGKTLVVSGEVEPPTQVRSSLPSSGSEKGSHGSWCSWTKTRAIRTGTSPRVQDSTR